MTTTPPLAIGMTRDQFTAYVESEVARKMKVWRPRGCVLHNTDAPTLAQFYKNKDKPLSGPQRVKNMWVSYQNAGWSGGPHLVITDREILLGNPLWLKGVHSPSYNATFWGIELAGSYEREAFPDAVRDNAVHAIAVLYAMLGHEPTADTFRFHKEDPRTTHRTCPGKNVGTKASWLTMIADRMHALHPGDCNCGDHGKALVA